MSHYFEECLNYISVTYDMFSSLKTQINWKRTGAEQDKNALTF